MRFIYSTHKPLSWGRLTRSRHDLYVASAAPAMLAHDRSDQAVLAHGLGRSYGDVCLNSGGALLLTRELNKFILFDRAAGILEAESGVSLDEILKVIVPAGWFLPVVPGTKFVTLGGAIANDIHGKNHHRRGTFGSHVQSFDLLRSDADQLLHCSPNENTNLFNSTIGGIGLTGLIVRAKIKLMRIPSSQIDVEYVRLETFDDFFRLSAASDRDYEFTVAWIDSTAPKNKMGRGIFMRGNWSTKAARWSTHGQPVLALPCELPGFLLRRWSMRIFNWLYLHQFRGRQKSFTQHYNPFFFPLDFVGQWNLAYGGRGFFQYQCALPDGSEETVHHIFTAVGQSGTGSFLTVLKRFGDHPSPGMMSFPRQGYTISLDLPNGGAPSRELLHKLDKLVFAAGGRLYSAKDASMAASDFKASYPEHKKFATFIDPKFSSDFWRRVTT